MTDKSYSPGLEGVIAGESALSRIDIDINRLILHGYDLVELTENASYEEVAYLLIYSELPTVSELAAFNQQLRSQRDLPGPVVDLLRSAPADAHPMDLLRTAVSSLAFFDAETPDNSHDANVRKSVRLLAKIPTALAYGYRFSQGLEPVAPDAELDHAANLLYMLRGEKPPAYEVEAMNTSLILYAEHGYNASTFTARVVASTLADLYAAITAAIGALHGPLHGGANEAAMHMLLEVDSPAAAEQWVLDALAQKKKIMGFGHREVQKRRLAGTDDEEGWPSDRRSHRRHQVARPSRRGRSDDDARKRHLPQRRFPLRVHLLHDGHPDPALHPHLRGQPRGGLGSARDRTARRQPTHPPQPHLHRARAPRICAARRAGLTSAPHS